jgi:disulfide bond formation protein DsbB
MKREPFFVLLSWAVLLLSVAVLGSAVFVLGFGFGDSPCVLCWAQRTGMTLVALMGVFVLRYGARPRYLGWSVLVAAFGLYMGVRHSAAHVVRDVGQGFSVVLFGAHTYIWSIFIFWMCAVLMGVLLLLLPETARQRTLRPLRPLERVAMWSFLAVVAGNIVQAFASTGPPPYMGQSDPVRFSFTPRHWVWSTEEWAPAPISRRGRWAIERPATSGLPVEPADAPVTLTGTLDVSRRLRLRLPTTDPVTDLAYEASSDRFALTTAHGVYLLDGALERVVRHTVVDAGFSVDLDEFAGAAFLDAHTVLALARNKSYVVLREAEHADPVKNYRYFLESFDAFEEVARSRFATVRSKLMYVMSVAYVPETQSVYTVMVPNRQVRQLVVSRFDRRDMTLSEEFLPAIADGSTVSLRPGKRSLAEFYVTGATAHEGRLYAISAAYGVLLTIDLASHTVLSAHAVPGVTHPTGLAVKGEELFVVDGAGAMVIVGRPGVSR